MPTQIEMETIILTLIITSFLLQHKVLFLDECWP